MINHDFKKGQSVCTLADPQFTGDVFEILIGTVIKKDRFVGTDEVAYDIQTNDGIKFSNIPGIYVYGSVQDLHEDVLRILENNVKDMNKRVDKLILDLALARTNLQRSRVQLRRWSALVKAYGLRVSKKAEES